MYKGIILITSYSVDDEFYDDIFHIVNIFVLVKAASWQRR